MKEANQITRVYSVRISHDHSVSPKLGCCAARSQGIYGKDDAHCWFWHGFHKGQKEMEREREAERERDERKSVGYIYI